MKTQDNSLNGDKRFDESIVKYSKSMKLALYVNDLLILSKIQV